MRKISNGFVVLCVALLLTLGISAGTAVAEQEITIGAVLPMTGPLAFAGAICKAGLEDSIEMANSEGGINGKKMRLVIEDGQYNPKVSVAKFKKMMTESKPLAVFGGSTALGLAMAKDIRDKYKILYTSTSFSSKLAYAAMYPSIYVGGPTYGDQFAILLKYIAKAKKGKKVAFFYSDTAFGKDPIPFGRLTCKRLGLDLVAEEVVKLTVKDVTKQVLDLKEKKPDYVIFNGFLLSPLPQVIKQCKEEGINTTFMGTLNLSTELLLKSLGPLGDGFLGISHTSYWWMEDVPMVRKIREFNAKNHPEVTARSVTYLQVFLHGLIIKEVLKRADTVGQLNYEGIVKALQSLKGFETDGLAAPLTIRNNRFPVARIYKGNAKKGVFEPAPLPEGLERWIRVGY